MSNEEEVNKAISILNGVAQPLDLDALIAAARKNFEIAPSDVKDEIEAGDPQLINTLLAQAADYEATEKEAKRQREKITSLLADLTGEGHVLTVNKAPVFEVSIVESRTFNAAHAKSLFPDIPENAELWGTSTSTRRTYKR